MSQRKNENFIILLLTMGCIGLTVENILLKWEFWVPPVIIVGGVLLWVVNISGKPTYPIRKLFYFLYTIFAIFFHGVHETSFFDTGIVIAIVMIAFSFFGHLYMQHLLLAEYVCIMIIQCILAINGGSTVFDSLHVSRAALYPICVLLVYFCSIMIIRDRAEASSSAREKDQRIEAYEADMEDFLSNISHELRTPVNVVNGMSELIIKNNGIKEAVSIRDAGVRLAYQIEDIQDYTECKRNKIMLEEDDYMSISLINDVVTSFRLVDNAKDLVLVIDISPSVPAKMKGDVKKLHKIFRHLLENAVKFTKQGGIYVKMTTEDTDYGVNLCIEMTDTGIGMDRKALDSLSEGMFQVNKKRNRSSGGIGLGFYIVYGFAHKMGGFVKIESEKKVGTTVRVTIPQRVTDNSPCLSVSENFSGDILFHVKSDKYKVPKVRDFFRYMASNLAVGIHVPLYSAETLQDIDRLREKLDVKYIFMGQEEYEDNPIYFDRLSKEDVVVAVSAGPGFKPSKNSRVIVMPKPLYAYPCVKILNEGRDAQNLEFRNENAKPVFKDIRALIVDDEPMNLVVATSLFSEYDMIIETAGSGRESIAMFRERDYDIVFMDHMMPEMDGVEAMKEIKKEAREHGRRIAVVALTANAVSGAKEMFMKEGFDGFIAKPINMADFERVMLTVLPEYKNSKGGRA